MLAKISLHTCISFTLHVIRSTYGAVYMCVCVCVSCYDDSRSMCVGIVLHRPSPLEKSKGVVEYLFDADKMDTDYDEYLAM